VGSRVPLRHTVTLGRKVPERFLYWGADFLVAAFLPFDYSLCQDWEPLAAEVAVAPSLTLLAPKNWAKVIGTVTCCFT